MFQNFYGNLTLLCLFIVFYKSIISSQGTEGKEAGTCPQSLRSTALDNSHKVGRVFEELRLTGATDLFGRKVEVLNNFRTA